jgi:hypothetical protein
MGAGRPSEGLRHVDRLEGPEPLKRRLRGILETLTGEKTVGDACSELGIGEARFHELRHEALQSALEGLAPRPPGRPRTEEPLDRSQIVELRDQVRELQAQLESERVRTEIAMTIPHVLRRKRPPRVRQKRRR